MPAYIVERVKFMASYKKAKRIAEQLGRKFEQYLVGAEPVPDELHGHRVNLYRLSDQWPPLGFQFSMPYRGVRIENERH